jgi:hypothetical protein
MYKIKILFLLNLIFIIISSCSGQQKKASDSWSFQSIANVGLLEGETGSAFQLQTINGVRHKSWFAGLGLGLDYYRYRTIPLFIDIRKEFGKGPGKLFVYADGGISFQWLTDGEKTGYWQDDKYHSGFYSDFGFGYTRSIGNKSALSISLGYSYKKLSETYLDSYPYYYPANYIYTDTPPQNASNDQINYSLNRLSIKLGWMF